MLCTSDVERRCANNLKPNSNLNPRFSLSETHASTSVGGSECMRMRLWSIAFFTAATVVIAGIPFNDAKAQSVLQLLFGSPQSVKTPQRYQHAPSSRQAYRSTRTYHKSSSRKYRTMCVRLCDGFYFPIQSHTSRRNLRRDAKTCKMRCQTNARLFYMPANSTNVKNMVDLAGRRYRDLNNAFVYRKRLISGCTCRPMPWSYTERVRHERYAIIAAMDAAQKKQAEITQALKEERKKLAAAKDKSAKPDIIASRYVSAEPDIMASRYVTIDETKSTSHPTRRIAKAKRSKFSKKHNAKRKTKYNTKRKTKYAAERKTKKASKKKPTHKPNSWFISSGSKYKWPGDS